MSKKNGGASRGPDASHGQGFKAPEHNAPAEPSAVRKQAYRRETVEQHLENDPAFQARCVQLFGGERREYRDGIELLPVAEALADPTLVLV